MRYGIIAFVVAFIAAVELGQVQTQVQTQEQAEEQAQVQDGVQVQVQPATNGAAPAVVPPQDLGQALNEISLLVPVKWINGLIVRYLLTDAEFQAVVRAINSPQANSLWMRLRRQPELFIFRRWLKQQLKLSSSSVEWDDSLELSLIDSKPYWMQTLPGWQGFLIELSGLVSPQQIQQQIQLKVSQGGPIALWWQKLQALGVVYNRAILWPEAVHVAEALRQSGVDVVALDSGIRGFFGWPNATQAPVVGTGAVPGAAPVVAPGAGVVAPPYAWSYY